jgi:SAM-dependent methyltransferase
MTRKNQILRIYINRNLAYYSEKKLHNKTAYDIFFHISINDINFNSGDRIDEIINNFDRDNFNFKVSPLPICLFKSGFTNSLSKRVLNIKGKFLIDGDDFSFFPDEYIFGLESRMKIFYKCSECKFRINGSCDGIYILEPEKKKEIKFKEWVLSEISKNKKIILDLGCGDTPFLSEYMKTKNSQFLCIDPSSILIKNLNDKISGDEKFKIFPIIGIGEYPPLNNGIFDLVLLHYSYSHFIDIEKTMKNINRLLKKDGLLIIFEAYDTKKISESDNLKIKNIFFKTPLSYKIEFRNHDLNSAVKTVRNFRFRIMDSFEIKSVRHISWGIKAKKY